MEEIIDVVRLPGLLAIALVNEVVSDPLLVTEPPMDIVAVHHGIILESEVAFLIDEDRWFVLHSVQVAVLHSVR